MEGGDDVVGGGRLETAERESQVVEAGGGLSVCLVCARAQNDVFARIVRKGVRGPIKSPRQSGFARLK
jgi:hypothetical protein